jgi:ERF superfamily protein
MNMQSEQINELFSALAKAQGEMEFAIKNSRNPHFGSKFADLAGFWDACREPLSKNGLAIVQTTMKDEQGIICLITTLGHSSGQWIKSSYPMYCKDPNNPQSMGSSMTYARRYCLAAIAGVAPDEPDDDGNKASNEPKPDQIKKMKVPENKVSTVQKPIDVLVNKEQIVEFNRCYEACDDEFKKNIDTIFSTLGIPDLSQLKLKDYNRFMITFKNYFEPKK